VLRKKFVSRKAAAAAICAKGGAEDSLVSPHAAGLLTPLTTHCAAELFPPRGPLQATLILLGYPLLHSLPPCQGLPGSWRGGSWMTAA
jgi:hypothetical protein